MEFINEVFWMTGARIVIQAGYRNRAGYPIAGTQVIVFGDQLLLINLPSIEKNQYLGRKPKAFWSNLPESVMKPVDERWSRWIKQNLTGDELDPNESDEEESGLLKFYQRLKPDYAFRINEHGHPILPENWATKSNLEDWKHVLRFFIKI